MKQRVGETENGKKFNKQSIQTVRITKQSEIDFKCISCIRQIQRQKDVRNQKECLRWTLGAVTGSMRALGRAALCQDRCPPKRKRHQPASAKRPREHTER